MRMNLVRIFFVTNSLYTETTVNFNFQYVFHRKYIFFTFSMYFLPIICYNILHHTVNSAKKGGLIMPKLLLIDDDEDVLSLNEGFLQKEGFITKRTTKPKECIPLLKHFDPDCIVLDVLMPELNGFELCKEIRKHSDAPFLFLSGCTSEDDRLQGFSLGADDYITKPYSLQELSARIRVILRRNTPKETSLNFLCYPPLKLDLQLHKAYYNEEEIALSNREYELLYHLMSKPNQTLTFEKLGELIWGNYQQTDRKTLMVTASRLRKKLSLYVGLTEVITTVWSKGYQFTWKKVYGENEQYRKKTGL